MSVTNKYKGREKEYKKEWQQEHTQQHMTNSVWHRLKRKVIVLSIYSNYKMCCEFCGEDDIDVLTIDHINGGGHKHRRQINQDFYGWLVRNKFPSGYRVLCFNCNWKKRLMETWMELNWRI